MTFSAAVIFAGIFLLLAVYAGIDPLRLSPISSSPDFTAHKIDLPPWSSLPHNLSDPLNTLQNKAQIKFLNQIQGPESIAFDSQGRGPYTGVADGRILFWDGKQWTDFAYTSPNRSEELCGPPRAKTSAATTEYYNTENEHVCGRPLGLRFETKSGDLYIADAYFGLMKVGPDGGLAAPLATEAEGVVLKFTNDLDLDEEGNVYFTDSSIKYERRKFMQLVFSGENSGRLLKYNSMTKETSVLIHHLYFPNGVSMSKNKSFFLFNEGLPGKIWRYWLKGEKAGTAEVFALTPGFPDNVRTNEKGEFWVAFHCRRNLYSHILSIYPWLRMFILRLPIPGKYQYLMHIGGRQHALIVKYGEEGQVLQVLEDKEGKVVRSVSEVEEKDGKLWIGSVLMPFIAVY